MHTCLRRALLNISLRQRSIKNMLDRFNHTKAQSGKSSCCGLNVSPQKSFVEAPPLGVLASDSRALERQLALGEVRRERSQEREQCPRRADARQPAPTLPREDAARRWLSTSQGENSHRNPTPRAPYSHIPKPQSCEK